MNGMKQFTTKGIIACALMVLVVILTLFSNILVFRGETLNELKDEIEDYEDKKEIAFELYDADDMEEYLEELDCTEKEIKAGVKLDKFMTKMEDGKLSVFDLISTVSCFSAMKDAPDMLGFDSRDMEEVSSFWMVGVVLVAGYMLMPLLGVLYVVLHFLGYKNKGIPVLVLLALFVIVVGGFTILMTMSESLQVSISFTYVIALACTIASVALWKVEQNPQVSAPYYENYM